MKYQKIPKEIMTNQGENKNKNPINTGVFSILFTAWLIYYGGVGWSKMAKWVTFEPCFK